MRRMIIALAAVAVAAPLAAQRPMGKNTDPTHKVVASGKLPPGWTLRFDTPRGNQPTPKPDAVSFTKMGAGYHFKSGPAAIYYNPRNVGKTPYTVTATFTQASGMKHEAYGLFIGGEHLHDSTQSYLYFLVRPMDGAYLINHRAGSAVHKIVDWTPNPAMHKEDDSGKATNQLTIRVDSDSIHFIANGEQVGGLTRSDGMASHPDGQAGLRINHNLDVHVEGFSVKAGSK